MAVNDQGQSFLNETYKTQILDSCFVYTFCLIHLPKLVGVLPKIKTIRFFHVLPFDTSRDLGNSLPDYLCHR